MNDVNIWDEVKDDDKSKCSCDGKHVCKACLKKEEEYYKEW